MRKVSVARSQRRNVGRERKCPEDRRGGGSRGPKSKGVRANRLQGTGRAAAEQGQRNGGEGERRESNTLAEARVADRAPEAAEGDAQWEPEVGGFLKRLLFSRVYPSANTKVAEGRLIGEETGLSPVLSGLRRGDKDGASVSGGIVGGGGDVPAAFRPPRASGALAARTLRSGTRSLSG